MDMRVDPTRGDDAAFRREHFSTRADDHRVGLAGGRIRIGGAKSRLDAGITRMTDADDAAALHADVGLDDAEDRVENQCVRDDEVERLGVGSRRGLAHAIADYLAAAELHLVTIAADASDEVGFNFGEEVRIAEAHAVTDGRSVHLGVLESGKS